MTTRDGPATALGAEAHRTVRRSDGRTLAYATYGDPAGTPLAFLHGTPGSRRLGRLLDRAASRAGSRVIAPDRPGYGRSDPPADDGVAGAGRTIEALADAVGADRIDVAGFSGGGYAALAGAATVPERVGTLDLVSGAVPPAFVDEPATVHRVLGRLAEAAPSLLGACFRLQATLVGRVPGTSLADRYAAEGTAVPADVERVVREDFREAFAEGATGAVADSRRQANPWPFDLESTSRPVRLFHGTTDHLAPVDGVRRVADVLPDARLTEFEGVGHLGALLEYRSHLSG